jgi:aldose 1-epimerase
MRFADLQVDDVFTGLQFHGEWCEAALNSPDGRRVVTVRFDNAFRECVVFTPPHREAICIEPYTCLPDCFRFQPQGNDAGLRVLAPNDSFAATVEIRVS